MGIRLILVLCLWASNPFVSAASAPQPGAANTSDSGTSFVHTLAEQEYLTGDWAGARTRLEKFGISPFFTFTTLTFTNTHGGIQTGSRWGGLMAFGADFSFEKLWGWSGGSFHLDFHWWQGDQPSTELIGNFGPDALSGWEASNAFRVYRIYFQQEFQGGDYLFKIGQIALDDDFQLSEYAGLFLNTAFGDMPSRASASNAPVYPLAAPGLYIYAKPGKEWFLRGGLYTSDAGEDIVSNTGFDWRIGGAAGYSIILELGIEGTLFGLPATYKIGGLYNTAQLDKLGTSGTVNGNVDIYVVADQALWVDEKKKPILATFVRVGTNPLKDRTEVGLHAGTGLNYFGPFGRADDAAGIAVSYNRFSHAFVQAADGQVSKQETILELTYQAVLTPWLTLQPDLQFIFDPVFSRRNAYVIMMQAEITF